MRSSFAIKNLFFLYFFGHEKNYQQKQGNDIPTIILTCAEKSKDKAKAIFDTYSKK